MGLDAPRQVVWGLAALVVLVGAGYPLALGRVVGVEVGAWTVAQSAALSLSPALAVVLVGRLARAHRAAAWTAAAGAVLVLGLGLALYAAALDAVSPRALAAMRVVPLRQLAAAAVAAWAVWWVRRAG